MQAPAECAPLDHGGEAFGDNRHLGDVAPVEFVENSKLAIIPMMIDGKVTAFKVE